MKRKLFTYGVILLYSLTLKAHTIDLTSVGTNISEWTTTGILNTSVSDEAEGKYAYDINGETNSYINVDSRVVFRFESGTSSKAYYIYPGKCFEFGRKNGMLVIKGVQVGDKIKLTVAAKGSTPANFEDATGMYPQNAIAVSTDLTLPAKGSAGGDAQGYIWKELEYIALGGDVKIKEFNGGYRIKKIQIGNSLTTNINGIWYGLNIDTQTAYVSFCSFYSNGRSGSVVIPSNITYGDGTYNVTRIADYAFSGCTGLTSIAIPNTVTSIEKNAFSGCTGLTSPVYNAHIFAFMPTTYSGAYTIPDGIESIAEDAFYGCSSLTSVAIPNSITNIGRSAFRDCSALTSIEIPDSVISIGSSAFEGCTGLTSVIMGNSVISIGHNAFNGCTGLTSVHISDLAAWCGILFEHDRYTTFYGSNPLRFAGHLYINNNEITELVIPDAVTMIGAFAFYGCTGLTSIAIPNTVTSIGGGAFEGCKNLNKVTIQAEIPPTLKTYQVLASTYQNTFKNVASDLSIYVPCGTFETYQSEWSEYSDKINYPKLEYTITGKTNNEAAGQVIVPQTMCDSAITAMPNNGYYFVKWSDGNTDNPRTIVLTQDTSFTAEFAVSKSGVCGANNALTWSWDDTSKTLTISENGALTENYTFGLEAPTQLQKLVVGNEVTAIGDSAFYGMKTLTRMTLGNGLESIGNYAFMNCSKLTEAVIPSSVITIGKGAFMNGNRLQKITLGANIESIEASAFANCPYLLEVQAKMEFPPIIDASVFADCGDLSGIDCYVPEESIVLYKKTAVWKEFHLLATPAETPTALEQVGNKASTMVQKILRDGQILILRGDRTYTITGQEVR